MYANVLLTILLAVLLALPFTMLLLSRWLDSRVWRRSPGHQQQRPLPGERGSAR